MAGRPRWSFYICGERFLDIMLPTETRILFEDHSGSIENVGRTDMFGMVDAVAKLPSPYCLTDRSLEHEPSAVGRGRQGEGGETKVMLNDSPQRSRRRLLRRKMTAAERTLWSKLRGYRLNGHRFHRQTSIENYVVDFYCAEKRLILEIDGSVHSFYGKAESDLKRQKHLETLGFKVLRFTP